MGACSEVPFSFFWQSFSCRESLEKVVDDGDGEEEAQVVEISTRRGEAWQGSPNPAVREGAPQSEHVNVFFGDNTAQ